jgi:hypothetical protein
MTEVKRLDVLERVGACMSALIKEYAEVRFNSHFVELKKFLGELAKKDGNVMTVARLIEKNNIKTGFNDDYHTEDSMVSSTPGAPNAQKDVNAVFDQANRFTWDGGKKTVCIKIMLRGNAPFVMSFEYTGDAQEELKTTLMKIYPNATLSITNEHVIISEYVDNYADYGMLIKNNKLTPFASDMRILELDFL